MSVLDQVERLPQPSAAENQVREYILKYPKRCWSNTVYELAKESFTSPATVVRLEEDRHQGICQAEGAAGGGNQIFPGHEAEPAGHHHH